MPEKKSLIIFIKTPNKDNVKTRLARDIGKTKTLQLYQAFLKDLDLRFNGRDEFSTWYAIAPEQFKAEKLNTLIRMKHFFIQNGTSLGDRMYHAFEYIWQQKYAKTVLIGSDIPQITHEIIADAFAALDNNECALGPAKDGGYYLIGLQIPEQGIFQNIAWGSEIVMEQTLNQLKKLKKNTKLLAPLYDIDTGEDLKQLAFELANKERTSPDFPHHTWQQISAIMKIYQ